MSETANQKIQKFRNWMFGQKLGAYIIPSTDPHASEYVPAHWESRKWITGFDGSAGTAVVTLHDAALWTDSRYFLAAERQLADTPFHLMRDGLSETPSICDWLSAILKEGDTVGIDGNVFRHDQVLSLRQDLERKGIGIKMTEDPMEHLWPDRPPLPTSPLILQPLRYAGESTISKTKRLREMITKANCDCFLSNTLDETAWLLNMRGQDVHCNPVFISYCIVDSEHTTLYINEEKLTAEIKSYLLSVNAVTRPYEEIIKDLIQTTGKRFWVSPSLNEALTDAIKRNNNLLVKGSPISNMKAVKNDIEIQGFRNAMERDGVAMVKFLKWLESTSKEKVITEIDIEQQLYKLRAEQPLFKGISFDTIAGYGDHGAIVHYEATPSTNRIIEQHGLLLIDSGAHYQDGTTDITRTIAMGPVSEEERLAYTLVLKGHIALSRLIFPSGSTGTQLDLAARSAMWAKGYNYGHGTGHGVGSWLNVHEGPHQIRMNNVPALLMANMTVTNEPGIYVAGNFGVRIENVMLTIPHQTTPYGHFLAFESLTLCPIDLRPIDFSLLSSEEIIWVNNYHQKVWQRLSPLLEDAADKEWLFHATQPIELFIKNH